jgi:tetratricopeptide (TPR) repeat protein
MPASWYARFKALISYFARDYSRATERLGETIEIDPDFPVPYWGLALVDEQLGRYDEAVAEIEHAMDLAGRGANSLASLGHVYGVSGRSGEAEAILQEVEKRAADRHLYSYQVALVYAGLSRVDEAFEWLDRAYDERSPLLGYVKADPRFDDLRDDPRFTALLRRMNLGD